MAHTTHDELHTAVNFSHPRRFATKFKFALREALFPDDDPFGKSTETTSSSRPLKRVARGIQYFIPIFEWLPRYSFRLFLSDLLAGLTITSLAIPQGISYAKLAQLPPVIGLYSAFVPPIIYTVFGSSRHVAVGTVASCSLLIYDTLSKVASPETNQALYVSLVFTATFITGVFQTALGILRLGILVDFFSHSTITGFMGGTAVILILQQLKGVFGLKHFTTKTSVQAVIKAIWDNRRDIRWETTVLGVVLLIFLQVTRYVKTRNSKLFWVPALAPIVTVVVAGVFTYLVKGQNHGIQIVGHLDRGINPSSIKLLNFDSKYISAVLKAGIITGILSLAEGIAIGRSFAVIDNTPHDGNKEMIAFGLMNLCGSFSSCYLTSGPFSKTAVNYNAGCKTAMSNLVEAVLMALTLQFLAPLFGYTPLVALSVIIISAMIGLFDYEKMIHLFKVDKFDFLICMACFFGVAFISMDIGLLLALLYVARPATCKLGKLPDSGLYRDVEQYPTASSRVHGVLVVQLGSPLYFANAVYVKQRIMRYIRSEEAYGDAIEQVILDLSGVTSIDTTGIEGLLETRRALETNDIPLSFVNPRLAVMEKLILSKFVEKLGKDSFYLTLDDAVVATQYSLHRPKKNKVDNDIPV
ncbi:putative sulfate transporter 3.5 [Senna tora]|uniref:Putative sulfate transporter 3.5 n=1 Tax=Senna tora TaxID=362788 RepID=A0A834TCT9_9FABA|nr:putative sulfate transporter 3.5 [Senna tora]